MLVAAVLRPQQREDRELEVVGLALQQAADTAELAVREAQGTVQRLFGDRAQEPILARVSDGGVVAARVAGVAGGRGS